MMARAVSPSGRGFAGIIGLLFVLAFGLGLALWPTNDEFNFRVKVAADLAAMAQLAAEERASALCEKLDQEEKMREEAEQAWKMAANRAADLAQQLIGQIGATRKLEAKLADMENELQFANQKILNQIAAGKEMQTGLYNANTQVRILSATLQHASGNKEGAEAARMKAEAEAKAADEKAALEINTRKAALIIAPVITVQHSCRVRLARTRIFLFNSVK